MLSRTGGLRLAAVTLIVMVVSFYGYAPQGVHASGNPTVPLYLHQLPGVVTVAGVPTNLVMNTTTLWDGPFTSPNLKNTPYNFTL